MGLIAEEALAGFKYLSHIDDPVIAERERDLLSSKIRFIPEAHRLWFQFYLDYLGTYSIFVPWDRFLSESGAEDISLPLDKCEPLYHSSLVTWEGDYLIERLKAAKPGERGDIIQKLVSTVGAGSLSDSSLVPLSLDLGPVILGDDKKEQVFRFPSSTLTDRTVINPGTLVSVIAPPGGGKTHFALNCAYVNSVLGPMRTLYIYLENIESNYFIELLSRHSKEMGLDIQNQSLKRGVLPEDAEAVREVTELRDGFAASMKERGGSLYFLPFSKFHPDPLRFSNQLAGYVKENRVDFIVFDYIQAAVSFISSSQDPREYMNRLVSAIRQVCIGSFGSPPAIGMVLAQPKKEAAEKNLAKSGTAMTLFDTAEVTSIERDSFVVIGLHSDPGMRKQGNCVIKILKNRDLAADDAAWSVPVMPQYCVWGDAATPAGAVEDVLGW